MEDIQVNEYVRTKNKGIKRIDTIFENKTVNKYGYEIGSDWDGKEYGIIKTTDIVKHSKDIIDLIEVGDYVNGYKVISIDQDVIDDKIDCIELDLNNNYQYNFIAIRQIKSILTHEQYEANCYKVKEEK